MVERDRRGDGGGVVTRGDEGGVVTGRAMYAGERIGVTRNGKLAAAVIGVSDPEALEAFEMAQDVAAYKAAKTSDDATRVSLRALRDELTE